MFGVIVIMGLSPKTRLGRRVTKMIDVLSNE